MTNLFVDVNNCPKCFMYWGRSEDHSHSPTVGVYNLQIGENLSRFARGG